MFKNDAEWRQVLSINHGIFIGTVVDATPQAKVSFNTEGNQELACLYLDDVCPCNQGELAVLGGGTVHALLLLARTKRSSFLQVSRPELEAPEVFGVEGFVPSDKLACLHQARKFPCLPEL
jgi:hypothetical protein